MNSPTLFFSAGCGGEAATTSGKWNILGRLRLPKPLYYAIPNTKERTASRALQIGLRLRETRVRADLIETLRHLIADHVLFGHQRGVQIGQIVGLIGRDTL